MKAWQSASDGSEPLHSGPARTIGTGSRLAAAASSCKLLQPDHNNSDVAG